ncbi:MAG: reverse transcriptase-like protein, partial [Rhodoluna sp.]
MNQQIIIEADGGSRGNPGPSGSGTILIDRATGQLLAEAAIFHGIATNNYAEYKAVIVGFELANELAPVADVTVRMDSKLVVEQASGRWKIKHEGMTELNAELRSLIGPRTVNFEWVPREENVRADALANEAMDAEKSIVRKFVGEPGTSSIQVVTESVVRASELEYNPELPSSVRAPRNLSKKLTPVLLIRHGRTALTESPRISGRGGVEDPPLSISGLDDANRVSRE